MTVLVPQDPPTPTPDDRAAPSRRTRDRSRQDRLRRRRRRGHLPLALAAVLLTGCVNHEPDPLDPPEELRSLSMRAETPISLDGRPEGPWSSSWFPLEARVRFDDGLTLAEAHTLALFFAPDVVTRRTEARVAGALVLQAGLLRNPDLFVGPRVSIEDGGLVFPAGISWELPLWGEREAEEDAAEARWTEERLRVVETELASLQRVRESYVRLARLRREQELLAELVEGSDRIVSWVEAMRGAGETDAVALYLAKAERDSARAELERVRAEAGNARRDWLASMGLLPDAPVEPVLDDVDAVPELEAPTSEALLRHPAARAAEAAHAAAEAELRHEIRRQYPSVRLGPEAEYEDGDTTIGLGLGITLPLFDRNRGNIAAALEARDAARQRYRSTLLRLAHDEAELRAALDSARRLLRIYREGAMQDAETAARVLDVRIRAGTAEVLEVLAAKRALTNAEARLLELEERATIATLRAAVAGGLALEPPTPAENRPDTENES